MAENTGKNGQTTTESEKKSDFSWTQPHPLFVIVFVGPEKTPFGIQKTFLCHRSAFFRDLLASRDKQEDKVEDTVDLPDVSVEIFGLLQYFIYTGKVAATDESIPPYDVLVGLWKLGHRLGVDGLCDMTLSTMIRCRRTTGRIPSTPLLVQVWKDTPEGSPIRTLLLTWAAEYMRSSDSRAEFAKSLPQEVLSELVVAMSSLEAARPAAPQPVAQHSAQATPSSTQRKNVHYLDEPSEEEHLNGVKKTRRVDGTGSLPSASPLHDAAAQLNRRPSRPILVKPQKRRSSAAFVDPSTFTTAQKMEFCSDLLARMLSGPGFWTRLVGPFREPVEPKEDGVPDYFDKVSRPMDLSTIKSKMDAGEYADETQFLADIRQIFENCFAYWKKGDPMYAAGEKLQKTFEDKYSGMNKWISKMGGDEPE